MIQISIANQAQHTQPIREFFWQYLQWANAKVEENFGVRFDIAAMLEQDIRPEEDGWKCIQSGEKSELRITVKRTWRTMPFIHN